MWYWDGSAWQRSLSQDGFWRWDGSSRQPTGQARFHKFGGIVRPDPPSPAYRRRLLVTLGAAMVFVVALGAVAIGFSANTEIDEDWKYLAGLSAVELICLLVAVVLLARPMDWSRAFAEQAASWRVSIVTAALIFGACGVLALFLVIVGGILTEPDFLATYGRGSARDAIFAGALLIPPVVVLGLLTSAPSWRHFLAAPLHLRSAAQGILLVAMLLSLPVVAVVGSAKSGGQLAVVMVGLLVPSVVGFVGLLVHREWGRSVTTVACACWSWTGIGLVFGVPLLLLLWIPIRASSAEKG
jgi:hypothetical protein